MKLKKIAGLAAAALVLVSGVFAGGAKEESGGLTIAKGVLKVGMEIGYPPMEYFDTDGTTPIGFDVRLANALAAKLGFKVELIDTAWDGIFAGVDTGKYDCIISTVTITDERLAKFNFLKPYIVNAQALVLPRGSTVSARSLEQITGLNVAYQAETTTDDILTGMAEAGLQFQGFEYDKVINCFDELRSGRVDAVVCDSVVAYFYAAQPDSAFEIVWEGAGETIGVCLKKGNDALTTAMEKALDELFADGTIQQISSDIFGRDLVSSARN
jgi:polar amino acid transport system substrate-binding protein